MKVEGRLNIKEDEITISALKLQTLSKHEEDYLVGAKERKSLTINIPEGLSEIELKNLREFIKKISNQKGNMKVTIDNKGNQKEFDMLINERVYKELREMIGEENLSWK